MTNPTPQRILATPMGDNDANAATIRDYLVALLLELWREEGNFSGKNPFGNDGWQYEVYGALYDAGLIEGRREYGDLTIDAEAADDLIDSAIRSLGQPKQTEPGS